MKKIENKTKVKKGSILYNIWNTDNVDVYEVTSVNVLNERAVDVTMRRIGEYDHIGQTLDDNKYRQATRVRYEHIIMENDPDPRFLNTYGFVNGNTWHLSKEECEKRIESNFSENKYWRLLESFKTIYEFLNERRQ